MASRPLMRCNAVKGSSATFATKSSRFAAAKPCPGTVNAGDMIRRQRPARLGG